MGYRSVGVAICAVFICLLGLTTVARYVWSQETPRVGAAPQFAKGNKQKIDGYIVLLRLRHDLYLRWKDTGKWPDDKEANAALSAHGQYWAKQLGDGHAILAGGMKGDYWDNAAIIIFEAESEEAAQKIVKADPAVKAYVFQAQVRPFDVSYITDKYGKK